MLFAELYSTLRLGSGLGVSRPVSDVVIDVMVRNKLLIAWLFSPVFATYVLKTIG